MLWPVYLCPAGMILPAGGGFGVFLPVYPCFLLLGCRDHVWHVYNRLACWLDVMYVACLAGDITKMVMIMMMTMMMVMMMVMVMMMMLMMMMMVVVVMMMVVVVMVMVMVMMMMMMMLMLMTMMMFGLFTTDSRPGPR